MEVVLPVAERTARRAGLFLLLVTLATILHGLWRSAHRPPGHGTGHQPRLLRTPAFYFVASTGYFGLCYRLWRPLPLTLAPPARTLALIMGAVLYYAGLALTLWGRLALGEMYNVSSSFGAELYTGHRLVNTGPFALLRHPIYLGILLAEAGGLMMYRTWTFPFVLGHFPALLIRARHEEELLAAEFGEQWQEYCQRVPAWLPRFPSRSREGEQDNARSPSRIGDNPLY